MFGRILSFGLWGSYESGVPAFAERLLKILAACGTAPPLDILGKPGPDLLIRISGEGATIQLRISLACCEIFHDYSS
jgi:hypothetical protein